MFSRFPRFLELYRIVTHSRHKAYSVWLNVRMSTDDSSVPLEHAPQVEILRSAEAPGTSRSHGEVVLELETELRPSSLTIVIRSRSCSKFEDFCHVCRH